MITLAERGVHMTTVTKKDIINAAKRLGIESADSIIIHSSLKSMGYVEGGADAVIDGFYDAVSEGTLIFPTLCQKDWENVYKNWHPDADSDVGYITNVFRKRENAFRSNQATHSVAAMGKDAKYITETHGESGKRIGPMGDTPFSADSPWEKMYKMNTKVVFLGVGMLYGTFRHYAEYVFINNTLDFLKDKPEYEELKNPLWLYNGPQGVWPHIENEALYPYLKEEGKLSETTLGDAKVICIDSKTFVDECIKAMEKVDERFLWNLKIYYEETLKWLKKVKKLKGN